MQALLTLLLEQGAPLVFGVTLAARAGVPVPAAPLLVVAGSVAVTQWGGVAAWLALLALATLANLGGDALWYLAGRRYGRRVMGLLCRFSLSPDSCVLGSESLMRRWGGSALLAAKFVPGVSVVAAPMAGAMGMRPGRFVALDLLAGAIWSALFLGLGALFRSQVEQVLAALAEAGIAAALVVLALVAGFVAWRWWRRHRLAVLREVMVDAALELDGAPRPARQ